MRIEDLPGSPIIDRDVEKLQARWISPEGASEAFLRRVDNQTARELLGKRNGSGDYQGIFIPYFQPGEREAKAYRIRRDHPDLEPAPGGGYKEREKYSAPPEQRNRLYFAPNADSALLSDTGLAIVITEGEFKTLALWRAATYNTEPGQPRFLPVGLSGVWNWRGTVGKEQDADGARVDVKGAIPDLNLIDWRGRLVVVAFDSDASKKPLVRKARSMLSDELRRRGARVAWLEWEGPKGIDDWLAAVGPDVVLQQIANASEQIASVPTGFELTEVGLFRIVPKEKRPGEESQPDSYDRFRLCRPLAVIAQTSNDAGGDWGILTKFADHGGRTHEVVIPREALGSERAEWRKVLDREGLDISPGKNIAGWLRDYLTKSETRRFVRITDRVGWTSSGTFVTPAWNIPAEAQKVVFDSETDHLYGLAGDAAAWRDTVAARCVGNPLLIFAVSAGLAPALLRYRPTLGGGFHFGSGSTDGKSTALIVAGSVWGGGGRDGFVRSWHTTDNAAEAIAVLHNDALLCLDELKMLPIEKAGTLAYLLANGHGKGRAARDGRRKRTVTWQLIFLSNGELGFLSYIRESGQRAYAGQEIRVLEIPSNSWQFGAFDSLHGFSKPEEFAKAIASSAKAHYGWAARRFVEYLYTSGSDRITAALKNYAQAFLAEQPIPEYSDATVRRAAERFSLVAEAGELGIAAGILPWRAGDAIRSVAECCRLWVDRRGSAGSLDHIGALQFFKDQLLAHELTRFQHHQSGAIIDRFDRPVINRLGFFNLSNGGEYQFVSAEFPRELRGPYDHRTLRAALITAGAMETETVGRSSRDRVKRTLPEFSGKQRCLVVSKRKLFPEDDEE